MSERDGAALSARIQALQDIVRGLLAVAPCNWNDGEDPEQAAAWGAAFDAMAPAGEGAPGPGRRSVVMPPALRVREAYDAVRAAEAARDRTIKECFPVGSVITLMHGDHGRTVEVLDHGADNLRVRNLDTRRVYWVGAYRIMGVLRPAGGAP